jgi:hypothetical protein
MRISSILCRLSVWRDRTLQSCGDQSQLPKRDRRHHAIFWYNTTNEKAQVHVHRDAPFRRSLLYRLNADRKLFRLLTFACLLSGTGGGGGTLFALGLVPLTVERRFAVLAAALSPCGSASGGESDFDLLREWLFARVGFDGVSR